MTDGLSGVGPMETSPRPGTPLKRVFDTPIGEVTDISTDEERAFWGVLTPVLKAIEEAHVRFQEFTPTADAQATAAFFSEQAMKMAAHSDRIRRVSPPKKRQKQEQISPHAHDKEQSESVQRAIESLTLIQKKTKDIFKLIGDPEGEKCINAQLITPLSQFQKYLEGICPVNPEKLPPATDVELLDRALTTQDTLTPEQQVTIQTLLERAIGNRDLNRMLKEKKPETLTKAERFLLNLTYTTMKAPSCAHQLELLGRGLQQTHAVEFTASVKAYKEKKAKIDSPLRALTREIGKPWVEEKDLTTVLQNIETLSQELTADDSASLPAPPFDQHRLKTLLELAENLQKIPMTRDVPLRIRNLVKKSLGLIQDVTQTLQRLSQQQQEYETQLQNGSLQPPLTLRDYWKLRRYRDLSATFTDLQEKGVDFSEPRLSTLQDETRRAREGILTLNSFFDSLPSFATGDIVFLDDGREKIRDGEKPITTLDEAKVAFQTVFTHTGDINEAIWPLRALGSKGIAHVAYAFSKGGRPQLLEMGDTCDINPAFMPDGQLNISFRPHLVQLLTPEAKEAITSRLGPRSDEDIERGLLSVYDKCLQKYLKVNEERFKTFDNRNALHAIKSFINKPLSEMPEGSLIRQLFEWAKKKFPDFLKARAPMEVEGGHGTEMLCSELVAEVIRDVQLDVEHELQQQFGVDFPILRPVIPPGKDLSTYTIDSLVDELKRSRAYSRVPEPLSTRLFVALPPPCEALQ